MFEDMNLVLHLPQSLVLLVKGNQQLIFKQLEHVEEKFQIGQERLIEAYQKFITATEELSHVEKGDCKSSKEESRSQ